MKEIITNFIDISRIRRPSGIILLLLPCLIGVFTQIEQPFSNIFDEKIVKIIILFTLGAITMRSAGCIINDIFDRKIDPKVSRTKNRPLASGKMPINQAIFLLIILLVIGFVILIQFNIEAIICGIFSLFLVILYPLMKRITHFPQIFLGIVYNIGFLIATLQIKSAITKDDFLIYLALVLITFIYDTIYGFQDIEDDLKIGVKSSSIAISKSPKRILIPLLLISFLLIIDHGLKNQFNILFYSIILPLATYSILLIKKWEVKNQQNCLKIFKKFTIILTFIMIAFIFKL